VIAAFSNMAAFTAKAATTNDPHRLHRTEDPVKLGLSLALLGRAERDGCQFLQLVSDGEAAGTTGVRWCRGHSCGGCSQSDQCFGYGEHVERRAVGCPRPGLQIQVVNASTNHEINTAFTTFVRERPTRFSSASTPF